MNRLRARALSFALLLAPLAACVGGRPTAIAPGETTIRCDVDRDCVGGTCDYGLCSPDTVAAAPPACPPAPPCTFDTQCPALMRCSFGACTF